MAVSREVTASPLQNPEAGPPTRELGTVNQTGVVPWSNIGWIDQQEHVPDLIWPNSVRTYNVMRKDAQIKGLLWGCTMPVRRYRWVVDPNGTPELVYKKLAADLNLPIKGEDDQPRGRSKGKFNFGVFLRHALLGLPFGHMFFEMVGEYRRDDALWHLTKCGERMPHTISQIEVNSDGTLDYIKQGTGLEVPEIPADVLVPFVWDREGGNWIGSSIIREMYKLWLIKDRVMRVNTMTLERNGMGVPIIEAPPNATRGQLIALNQMAQQFKAGETSGGAIPQGARLTLEGVRGNLPDALKTWELCNQEMSRSLLMMFIELGQTKTGSRALGSEFIDYFQLTQETIAIWVCETMAEELIEKWQFWNFGDKFDTSPLIDFERNEEPELAVQDLVMMVTSGTIHMDPDLEEIIRARYAFPEMPEEYKKIYFPKELPEQPSPKNEEQETPKEKQNETAEQQKLKEGTKAGAPRKTVAAASAASGAVASPAMLPSRRPHRRW